MSIEASKRDFLTAICRVKHRLKYVHILMLLAICSLPFSSLNETHSIVFPPSHSPRASTLTRFCVMIFYRAIANILLCVSISQYIKHQFYLNSCRCKRGKPMDMRN